MAELNRTTGPNCPVKNIRIGCSGWQYKHWRDDFYPAELPMSRWSTTVLPASSGRDVREVA
jgi:hypothetical protein